MAERTTSPASTPKLPVTPAAKTASTTLKEEEEYLRPPPPGRHPLPAAAPLMHSRSAVLFPHLAALSARPPSLGKSALQAAAKPLPLLIASLKGSVVGGNAVETSVSLGGGQGLARIGQPVVSLKAVVTTASPTGAVGSTLPKLVTTASGGKAIGGSSPARGSAGAANKAEVTTTKAELKSLATTTLIPSSSVLSKPPSPLRTPAAAKSSSSPPLAVVPAAAAACSSPPITSAAIISTIVGTVVQESLDRNQQLRRSQEKEQEEQRGQHRAKSDAGNGNAMVWNPVAHFYDFF